MRSGKIDENGLFAHMTRKENFITSEFLKPSTEIASRLYFRSPDQFIKS